MHIFFCLMILSEDFSRTIDLTHAFTRDRHSFSNLKSKVYGFWYPIWRLGGGHSQVERMATLPREIPCHKVAALESKGRGTKKVVRNWVQLTITFSNVLAYILEWGFRFRHYILDFTSRFYTPIGYMINYKLTVWQSCVHNNHSLSAPLGIYGGETLDD